MPLKKGRSKKIAQQNIGEIMSSYKKTGKIGTSRPKNAAAARKQAAAIAYSTAGLARKSKKARKKKK